MKNTILILLFSFISLSASAQIEKRIMNELQSNEYAALTEQMDKRLDLCILEDQEFMPKEEALKRIKAFNAENPISTWKLMHGGNSKANTSRYSVIDVQTEKTPYRLMIYYTDGMITEIRFE